MRDECREAAELGRKLYREAPPHMRERQQCLIIGLLSEAYLAEVEMDGTDEAHPAWWRGNDAGVKSLCQIINNILDGNDSGTGVASEPCESVRRRLIALREASRVNEFTG